MFSLMQGFYEMYTKKNEYKILIVGCDNAGKTTLFRIIMQVDSADSGKITIRKGIQAATLEQELDDFNGSVLERVMSGDPAFHAIQIEMNKLEKKIEQFRKREALEIKNLEKFGRFGRGFFVEHLQKGKC